MIVRADLHVHSKYSGVSPDWYLRLLKSNESYSEIDAIFFQALKRGQTFVTITDHDQIEGSLLLQEIFPTRVFSGVEFNVFFPEDHCKIHILVYGLTEAQYRDLMGLRHDIYMFRAYLQHYRLAYSVAHALMALDRKISRVHLEKLILLFDVFEGINGSQIKIQNQTWIDTLRCLTPERIDALYSKYHIEPISRDPWKKGITGGSDDHAGLFIGRTFTEVKADSVEGFLEALRTKQTSAGGSHSTFRDLSMSILKIAYDNGRSRPNSRLNSFLFRRTTEHVFNGSPVGSFTRLQAVLLKCYNRIRPNPLREMVSTLVEILLKEDFSDEESRAARTFECLANISDQVIIQAIQIYSRQGQFDLKQVIDQIKFPLTGLFLSIPFYTSLGFMNSSRHLVKDFGYETLLYRRHHKKKVLWFCDDPNIAEFANGFYDSDIIFVAFHPLPNILMEKQIFLPIIYKLPVFEQSDQFVLIPSLLWSLDQLADLQPDEIIISTAGPIGLIGLLLSKCLKVPSLGLPQESLKSYQFQMVKDPRLVEFLEAFQTWFFSQFDTLMNSPIEETISLPVPPVKEPLFEHAC